ncbi:hypothetical protein NEUTE1DRAFT_36312, partial [Neurospora tetrasperma FGSC 2508]
TLNVEYAQSDEHAGNLHLSLCWTVIGVDVFLIVDTARSSTQSKWRRLKSS